MTPFDAWYDANIAPMFPTDAPEIVKKISREMMANCWNAALDRAISAVISHVPGTTANVSQIPSPTQIAIEAIRARTTP